MELRDGMWAVLFTDLVGSTEQRARLGDAIGDALRREHDAVVARALAAHGGEFVDGTGDGAMCVFASAADAIAGGVAIQQGIERRNRNAEEALALRVGVSAGELVVEREGLMGLAAHEAARICGLCESGQVLVSDLVRLMAGSRTDAQFVERGSYELKGLPAPVTVWEITWKPIAELGPLPLPPALRVGRTGFFGRSAEQHTLLELWQASCAGEQGSGERGCVMVAGEAGIGKTRLAAELAVQVHAAGAIVLAGRCDEDLAVPYQPFVEALRYFVDYASSDMLRSGLGRYPGELVRLVPEVAERVPGLPEALRADPETERYRLFEAVASWLGAASREDPLLLVLDDLHWATKPTTLLLRHVLRAVDSARLLVVGTYRPTDIDGGHPLAELLADLHRRADTERLALEGLDDAAVAELLTDALGRPLSADECDLARRIRAETAGNAFFAAEVVRHLAETGRGQLSGAVPESVREVVGRRLRRLSEAANEILVTAAVIGAEFDLTLLSTVAERTQAQVLQALEEATDALLVEEIGFDRYRFAHALVRATVYDNLGQNRCVRLHRQVAEAIESIHADKLDEHLVAARAHHLLEAGSAASLVDVIGGVRAAAVSAVERFAYEEAQQLYERGLAALKSAGADDPDARLNLLLGVGDAAWRAGRAEAAREAFGAAVETAALVGDLELLTRAVLGWASPPEDSVGGDAEPLEWLERVAAQWPPTDDPLRARLIGRLAVTLADVGRDAAAALAFAEAEAIARRTADAGALAFVLRAWLRATLVQWDVLTRRRAAAGELIDIGERVNDLEIGTWGYRWQAICEFEAGNVAAVDASLDELERRSITLHQPFHEWGWVVRRAGRAAMRARFDEAEALWNRAFELAVAQGSPYVLGATGNLLFAIRYWQGRLGELEPAVDSFIRDHPERWYVLAFLCAETGRLSEARSLVEKHDTGDLRHKQSEYRGESLHDVALIAQVVATVGDLGRAERLLPQLEPFADRFAVMPPGLTVVTSLHNPVGRLAGTLGHHDDVVRHLRVAVAQEAEIGAIAPATHSKLTLARALTHDHVGAESTEREALLDDITSTAEACGMVGLATQAEELQRRIPHEP